MTLLFTCHFGSCHLPVFVPACADRHRLVQLELCLQWRRAPRALGGGIPSTFQTSRSAPAGAGGKPAPGHPSAPELAYRLSASVEAASWPTTPRHPPEARKLRQNPSTQSLPQLYDIPTKTYAGGLLRCLPAYAGKSILYGLVRKTRGIWARPRGHICPTG